MSPLSLGDLGLLVRAGRLNWWVIDDERRDLQPVFVEHDHCICGD
ncbi:MAG: hypothetical protein ACR2OC_09085 [Solirubrobacterales bacterium]